MVMVFSCSTYRQCCNVQQWPLCSDECLVPWTVPVEAGHTHHAGLGGTLVKRKGGYSTALVELSSQLTFMLTTMVN